MYLSRSIRLTVVAGMVAGLAAVLPVASVSAAVPASTSAAPVISANSFIESVGVNVHMYYSDTSYANTDQVVSLLRGLGVRHVRDGLAPNRPDEVAALQQLAKAGIRSSLIMSGTTDTDSSGSGTPGALAVDPDQLSELQTLAPSVDAVEPTNEYDCSGDASWASDLHTYSGALVQALQSSKSTQPLGVFAPAFCNPSDTAVYGSVDGSASVTNAHDYAAGAAPELALESRLPAMSAIQQSQLPMVVTETGYTNALNMSGYPMAVTEATAADYTLRTLLDDARLGIARTYLYELLDEKPDSGLTDPEQHYGLVRNDGTVKPAYTAVQNLLSDLAQGSPWSATAAGATTSSQPVTFTGGGSLLRSLVVTDPGGTGQTVALWLAQPLENTTTHAALPNPSRTIRLSLGTRMSATTRQPSQGNSATSLGTGTGFSVPVNGSVTLVHLTGPTATTASSCTSQSGYAAVAAQLGATAANTLAPSAAWSGSPTQASVPSYLPGGTQISADGQQLHVSVPGSPRTWTVAMWERTDAGSANYATFLHATNAAGALMRTYDLSDDAPSHEQISAYGLPATSAATFGTETWGQAAPGTWHLVSLTATSTGATLSIDGIPQGTVASSSFPLTGLDVGSVTSGYRGAVSGLEVFPKALTADQLAQLATAAQVTC